VVASSGWCSQVPEPELRVAGYGGDDAFGVGAPLGRVGAGMGWEGEHATFALRIPDLDCAIPGGGSKAGFGGEVPGAGKGFAGVFGEGCNGEGGLKGGVEEAERTVTTRGEEMGGVRFGMRDVVECVLSRIPARIEW
jgi:hypothetical protein